MRSLDVLTDPSSRLKRSTILGGLLSFSLIVVACFLLYSELSNYKETEITKNMFLDLDPDHEKVQVNFAIDLFNAPCTLIALDIHDSLSHHIPDVQISKKKLETKTMTLSNFAKPEQFEKKLEDVENDLNNGIGCSLEGVFELDKVSGNFHISFHSEMDLYFNLKAIKPEVFDKLNLSYQIKTLYFGRKENEFEMNNIRSLINELDLSDQLLQNFIDFQPTRLESFLASFWIEIIPYSLADYRNNYFYRSYQNSFNARVKPLLGFDRMNEIPILEFNYKFSALSAKYAIYAGSYKHILGTAFILLGGVYMFFNILNGVGQTLLRSKGLGADSN